MLVTIFQQFKKNNDTVIAVTSRLSHDPKFTLLQLI